VSGSSRGASVTLMSFGRATARAISSATQAMLRPTATATRVLQGCVNSDPLGQWNTR
jgi:hypothetical protein